MAFAHVLAGFVIQTDRDVEAKRRVSVMLRHALVVAVLGYGVGGFWYLWSVPLEVFVTHFGIDFAKNSRIPRSLAVFSADQLVHAVVIVALALTIPRYQGGTIVSYWATLVGPWYVLGLVLGSGFVVTVYSGSVVVELWVDRFARQLQADRDVAERGSPAMEAGARVGFVDGGRVIGRLERAIILILADQPAGIGFLIAAKSIMRFGDIGAGARRKEAEYIILGTFFSFVFGISVAYVTR